MTKYGIIISDVDEDNEHKEYHMYEKDIFDNLPDAQAKMLAYTEDKEYQYQEFSIIEIFTGE